MRCIMSALVLGIGLLNNFVTNDTIPPTSIIPSKTEQANLLLNVQEVLEQIKVLTRDEVHSTNISVVGDIELMVKRAEYILDLLQQITQLRMERNAAKIGMLKFCKHLMCPKFDAHHWGLGNGISCDGNSVCSLDTRPKVNQLSHGGKESLRNCAQLATDEVSAISDHLSNVTDTALYRGEVLLDHLGACSNKSGLAVISCYKGIIATDVAPVKEVSLGAIETHRVVHFKMLEIRKKANTCIDDVVGRIRGSLEEALVSGIKCKS